jgi:hypothetical protein
MPQFIRGYVQELPSRTQRYVVWAPFSFNTKTRDIKKSYKESETEKSACNHGYGICTCSKISANLRCVTVKAEEKTERARGEQDILCAIVSLPSPYHGWLAKTCVFVLVNDTRRYLGTSTAAHEIKHRSFCHR